MDILEDFKLHEETIARWIESCNDISQLPICENAIKALFIGKFRGLVDELDLLTSVHFLRALIEDQERIIKYYPEKPQPNANASPSY